MKIEDLKNIKIDPDKFPEDVVLRKDNKSIYFASFDYSDDPAEFETKEEALRAAALFRASHEMQKALEIFKATFEKAHLGNDEETASIIREVFFDAYQAARSAVILSNNTNDINQ